MAKRHIVTGVDIGTHSVRVVVCEYMKDSGRTRILGTGYAESRGLRHGYIVNTHDTTRSIRSAVAKAEKAAGVRSGRAYISAGGVGLEGVVSYGSAMIGRADGEITDDDMNNTLESAERKIVNLQNKKVIHSIPLSYRVDGKEIFGRPQGIVGTKLEVKALFITTLAQHLNDLLHSASEAGLSVDDVAAAPIAASFVTLTKQQKTAGCVLANIGAETVSIVVFENNLPISLKVFPIGSTDVTNDIALGLQISLEEAERLKIGGRMSGYGDKGVDDIILARMADIFELIEAHLTSIGRSQLLPAGIVITGGGARITTIEDMAKASLKLPSRVAELGMAARSNELPKEFKNAPFWTVAYGLCLLGFDAEDEGSFVMKYFHVIKNKIWRLIKQFLP